MRHETKQNITGKIRPTWTELYDNFTWGACSLIDNNVINKSLPVQHRSTFPMCWWQCIFAFHPTNTKVPCLKRGLDWLALDPEQPNKLHRPGQDMCAVLATLKQTQSFTLQIRSLLGFSSISEACEKSPKVVWPRTTWLLVTEVQQAAFLI